MNRQTFLGIFGAAIVCGIVGYWLGARRVVGIEARVSALETRVAKGTVATSAKLPGVDETGTQRSDGMAPLNERPQTIAVENTMSVRTSTIEAVPAGTDSSVRRTTPSQPPDPTSAVKIVAIESRVTETNSSWSKHAWILTLANESSAPQSVSAEIEFHDNDGFVVDSDTEYNLLVPGFGQQRFTGYDLVDAKVTGNIAKTVAKIRK